MNPFEGRRDLLALVVHVGDLFKELLLDLGVGLVKLLGELIDRVLNVRSEATVVIATDMREEDFPKCVGVQRLQRI